MTETAPAHGLERNATWYASWFDSTYYHSLYAHRDHAEAAAFVDALTMRLGLKAGVDLLDLGCGAGRHARQLAGHGMNVTGLDLSAPSIRHAMRYQGRTLSFRRHDMRAPFGYQAFDCVCSFFTSFGYFEDAADHLAVIRNVRRALRPGGHFVLDYLNVAYADQHLIPEETRQVDGIIYRIARWADSRRFFKHISVDDPRMHAPVEYQEQVARFTLPDFQRMLGLFGLDIVDRYGDYQLSPYDSQSSSRLILIARARAADDEALTA